MANKGAYSTIHTSAIVMLAAGFCVPVLAASSASLDRELSSPVAASVILFSVPLACSSIALCF